MTARPQELRSSPFQEFFRTEAAGGALLVAISPRRGRAAGPSLRNRASGWHAGRGPSGDVGDRAAGHRRTVEREAFPA